MGNVHETALFIKERGNSQEYHDITGKRIDSIYLRAPQNIDLLSIGLCSGINSGARAFLHVSEMNRMTDLLAETIELVTGHDRQTNLYELSKPVNMKKGQHYCISVEVYGGATFTYSEMHPFSTHRDLIIEISREPPMGFLDWTSNTTDNLRAFSKPSAQPNLLRKKSDRDSSTEKSTKSKGLKSLKNLEEAKDLSPIRGRKSSRLETQIDMAETKESRRSTSSSKNGRKLSVSSTDSFTPTSNENTQVKWFKRNNKGARINQITGIVFQRKSSNIYGCC